MKKNLSIWFISISACLLISISCTKDKKSYLITGTVIDQVTKQPVAGASVYRANRPSSDVCSNLHGLSSTLSDQSGNFRIEFYYSDYELPFKVPYVYASKAGFAGSNIKEATDAGDVGILELYHKATLKLHVKNDTISKLPTYLIRDDVYISLIGVGGPCSHPDFVGKKGWDFSPHIWKYCSGRNFDTVFVFSPVWANVEYYVNFYSSKPSNFPRTFTYFPIKIEPDSIAHLTVVF